MLQEIELLQHFLLHEYTIQQIFILGNPLFYLIIIKTMGSVNRTVSRL